MVAKAQVLSALVPWLGSALALRLDDAVETVTRRLNAWSPRMDLAELARGIDSLLFRAVREATQGKMLIQLEDGGWVRVRVEDFSIMADDALYPLFASLPRDAEHLLYLREYSMRCESLSCLKAQYLCYGEYQSPQELQAIAAFVKKCYPAYRWRGWLNG